MEFALNNLIALCLLVFFGQSSIAGTLTLHSIPSPIGINWKSPSHLGFSTLRNQIAKVNGGERHEIGHVYVELSCGDSTLYTGMTSQGNSEERSDMLSKGYGLGILFKTFAGMLDNSDATLKD